MAHGAQSTQSTAVGEHPQASDAVARGIVRGFPEGLTF